MKNIKVEVVNVDWDAPCSIKKDLPTSFTFEFNDLYDDFEDWIDIEEMISDKLSDETGYCHFGFQYVQLN